MAYLGYHISGREDEVMTPRELRSCRMDLGWSVDRLAYRLAVLPEDVQKWERGDAPIPSDVAEIARRSFSYAESARIQVRRFASTRA
jgi:predicted transcriptional regulator